MSVHCVELKPEGLQIRAADPPITIDGKCQLKNFLSLLVQHVTSSMPVSLSEGAEAGVCSAVAEAGGECSAIDEAGGEVGVRTELEMLAEGDMGELFANAMRAVVSTPEGAAIRESDVWRRVESLLPLLVQAQHSLLTRERARCLKLAAQRGHLPRVRFSCFDLSAVEPPSWRKPSSSAADDEEALLKLLAEIFNTQRELLAHTSAEERQAALEPLSRALRLCVGPQNERGANGGGATCGGASGGGAHGGGATSGAANGGGAHGGGATSRGATIGGTTSGVGNPRVGNPSLNDYFATAFEGMIRGDLILEDRMGQLASSLIRHHLHRIFFHEVLPAERGVIRFWLPPLGESGKGALALAARKAAAAAAALAEEALQRSAQQKRESILRANSAMHEESSTEISRAATDVAAGPATIAPTTAPMIAPTMAPAIAPMIAPIGAPIMVPGAIDAGIIPPPTIEPGTKRNLRRI